MRATFLHTLLLFLSLDGALSQSLSGLYWTAVQGTQQPAAAYAALSVVNASGVQIFGGATSAGPVATTLYWAASQSLVTGSALTNVPLPAYGAAVAAVPPYATAPYAAYAFGGTFSTGVTSSSWVAWDGVQWNALAVGGDSTFARVFATATYLSNCQGTGTACVFLMGGYTPGTPLSTTGLGTGVLWVPAAGPPTYQAITTLPGAGALPNPVYSHVAAAAPDGATVYVYGGIDSTGATVNSMYALNTAGWADSKVVLAELYNLAQSPDIQASSQPRTCVNSMGTVCASRNPQNLAGALSYPASVNDASSLGAGNIVGWGYRAIDGNTNGNYPSGSCTRSGTDNYAGTPYPARWRLDMLSVRTGIVQIQLFWRTDCCLLRTSGFEVWLGSNGVIHNGPGNSKVANPFVDAIQSPTVLAAANVAARYVWVVLPGAKKVLGICEIYILQRVPYVWRALTGLTNLALYSNAWQSSADTASTTLSALAFDASSAVNGILTDTSATASTVGLTSALAGTQYLAVDLGQEYTVSYIKYTDGSCVSPVKRPQSGLSVQFYLGSSADYKQNTLCYGPVTTNSGTTTCPVPAGQSWVQRQVPSCAGSARYVHVTKPKATVSATATFANMVAVGEIEVWGQSMPNLPSPRSGAGFAVYGAYLVVFGGTNAAGNTLNDLYVFDMASGDWVPPPPLGYVGTPPVARAFPVMGTLGSLYTGTSPAVNQMALFGGTSAAGTLSDFWLLNFPACPTLITSNTATVAVALAGLAVTYTCVTGYTSANPSGFVYCGVDGNWVGVLPLCSPTDPSLLPLAPTSVVAVAGVLPGSVVVSWIPAALGANPAATSYAISASPLDYSEIFTKSLFSWTYYNGDTNVASSEDETVGAATNSYTFTTSGAVGLNTQVTTGGAGLKGTCSFNTRGCGFFIKPFPTTISGLSAGGSWALESRVSFSPFGKLYPTTGSVQAQYIGIALFDSALTAAGIVSTGVHHWFAGLAVSSLGIQVGIQSFARAPGSPVPVKTAFSWWSPTATTSPQGLLFPAANPSAYFWYAFIRVERDAVALQWRLLYRFTQSDAWTSSPWFPDSQMLRGGAFSTPSGSNLAMSFLGSNENTVRKGYGEVDRMRWAPLVCPLPGAVTLAAAPATSAVVTGLTPGASYSFIVTPTITGGWSGPASAPSLSVPSTASLPVTPWVSANLLLVSSNKPAMQYSPATLGSIAAPSLTDGSYTTTVTTAPRTVPFTIGDWVMVDLGIASAVKEIAVWSSPLDADAAQLTGFRALVGHLPDWTYATLCDPLGVPTTVSSSNTLPASGSIPASSYAVRFPCSSPTGLVGRYVFIQAAPDSYLALREVQVFTTNLCAVARNQPWAAANTPPAPIGKCQTPNTPYGAACVQVCNTGYLNTGGSMTSTCNGDTWSDAPLLCAATCGVRAMPNLATVCTQRMFVSDFSQYYAVNGTWQDLHATPASLGPSTNIGGGALQIDSLAGCSSEVHSVVFSMTLFNWALAFQWDAVVVSPNGDRVGIVWHAQNEENLYRAVLNPNTDVHSVERIVGGVVTVLATFSAALSAGTAYNLTVATYGSAKTHYFVMLNSRVVMDVYDTTFLVGYPGVYAATQGSFTYAAFKVDCTGTGCANTPIRGTCEFTCGPGLTRTGAGLLTCVSNPAVFNGVVWDNLNGTGCILAPPIFTPTTVTLPENAPKSTFAGQPVRASLSSPNYQLTYTIVQQFRVSATNSTLIAQSQWPFTIDSCTGQVRVLSSVCTGAPNCALLDFEDPNWNTFALLVQVGTNGPAAAVRANVTVVLTNIDEPPVVLAGAIVSCPENAPPGFIVGVVPYFDPDTPISLQSFSLVTGSPFFAINALNGQIFTTALVTPLDSLNFESSNTIFPMTATVTQLNLPANTGLGTFSVQLIDRDDAPRLVTSPPLSFAQAAAEAATPLAVGGLLSTDQDVGIYTSLPSYSLVPPALAVNYAACVPQLPLSHPTTVATNSSGAPLFTVAPTGTVTLVAVPVGPAFWLNLNPFSYNGFVARAVYLLCVNSTDSFGAWAVAGIPVVVNASTAGLPIVSSLVVTTGDAGNLQTAGGDIVTVDGTAFQTFATKLQITGPTGVFVGPPCTIAIPGTQYTCVVPPGVGGGLTMSLLVNIGSGSFTPALTTVTSSLVSYVPPIVTGITGMLSLSTTGGELVTFTGSNFGPQDQPLAFPVISYGLNLELTCGSFQVSATPQTTLVCTSSAGAGSALPWSFSVPGFAALSGSPENFFAYTPPSIANVVPGPGVDLNNLRTTGGQTITFVGTNFGPVPSVFPLNSNVSFVLANSPVAFSVASLACIRVVPQTTIECITTPGVGGSFGLVLVVAGQASLPFGGFGASYVPPVITSTRGVVDDVPTSGNTQLTLIGSGFGPPGTVPTNVTYGHPGDTARYIATSCAAVVDSEMLCYTAPGVGRDLLWVANVGGQFSPAFAPGFSYAAPVILSYSGPGAARGDTMGGDVVVITGNNFGPTDAYTQALLFVDYVAALLAPAAGTQELVFSPAVCTITSASPIDESITCITAPGAGAGLTWRITLDGQLNVPPTTAYAPPSIVSVTDSSLSAPVTAANVNGGDVVYINGANFGPANYQTCGSTLASCLSTDTSLLQALSFGPTGNEYTVALMCSDPAVTVFTGCFMVVNDAQIMVMLPPGYGSNLFFSVTVADQFNKRIIGADTFSYALVQLVGPVALSPPTASTSGCSSGVTTSSACIASGSGCSVGAAAIAVTVNVINFPVLDRTTIVGAYFGTIDVGGTPPLPAVSGLVTTQPASLQIVPLGNNSVAVSFYVPPGAGLERALQLSVAPQNGAPSYTPISSAALFSYSNPVVSRIVVTKANLASVVPCPFSAVDVALGWSCSDASLIAVTLYGFNFGQVPSPCNGAACSPQPPSCRDGTFKWLSMQAGFAGPFVRQDSTAPSAIWVAPRWTDTQVSAYVHVTAGTVQMRIDSASALGCPATPTAPIDGLPATPGSCLYQYASANFTQLSPQVLPFAVTPALLATEGGSYFLVSVDNLNPGSSVSVFLGDPNGLPSQFLGQANVIFTAFPAACPGLNSAASLVAFVNAQLLAAPTAPVTLCVQAVPGQGSNVPVVAMRSFSGVDDYSNADVTIAYTPPTLSSVLTYALDGFTLISNQPWGSSTTVLLPTDGGFVKLQGSSLGSAPTVTLGAGIVLNSSVVTSCGTPNTCYSAPVPPGEGAGTSGASPAYSTPPVYATPFTLLLTAGNQRTTPVNFAYLPPTVSSVVSSEPDNSFPVKGGVTVTVLGTNFGATPPGTAVTPLRVWFYRSGNPALTASCPGPVAQGVCGECTNPVRISSTAISCTLPLGAASAAVYVWVVVADQSSPWPPARTLFAYDADPLITLVNVVGPGNSSVPCTVCTTAALCTGTGSLGALVRAPTDGTSFLHVCGTAFSVAPNITVAYVQWRAEDLVDVSSLYGKTFPTRCFQVPVPPGEGTGAQYGTPWRVLVNHYTQVSQGVPFAYNYPLLTGVTSLDGSFPTAGGIPVALVGRDFGTTPITGLPIRTGFSAGLSIVSFGLPACALLSFGSSFKYSSPCSLLASPQCDEGGFVPCLDLFRLNDTVATCLLPPGVGFDLWGRLTVADQSTAPTPASSSDTLTFCPTSHDSPNVLSYDLPVLSTLPGAVSLWGANVSSDACSQPAAFALPSIYPLLCDGTRGRSTMTIRGANFGPLLPLQSCVFLTWANRPSVVLVQGAVAPGYVPSCNGIVDWAGEGEVLPSDILAWNDTEIKFLVPPGLGWKQILVTVRGSLMALPPPFARNTLAPLPSAPNFDPGLPFLAYFHYADPVIISFTPQLVDTDGGTLVTLVGKNFGPSPFGLSSTQLLSYSPVSNGFHALASTNALNPPSISSSFGPNLPSAYIVVVFHRGCAAFAFDADGNPALGSFEPWFGLPTALSACSCPPLSSYSAKTCKTLSIVSQDHEQLQFYAPGGVGVNRTVQVFMVEHAGGVSGSNAYVAAAGAYFASYLPPSITSFGDGSGKKFAPVTFFSNTSEPESFGDIPKTLTIFGRNFGNPNLIALQNWTAEEQRIDVLVNGVVCVAAPGALQLVNNAPAIVCKLSSSTPVGLASVSITVAGQTATSSTCPGTPASLILACKRGYYALPGESCEPCPSIAVDAITPGAACWGFNTSKATPPSVVSDWLALWFQDAPSLGKPVLGYAVTPPSISTLENWLVAPAPFGAADLSVTSVTNTWNPGLRAYSCPSSAVRVIPTALLGSGQSSYGSVTVTDAGVWLWPYLASYDATTSAVLELGVCALSASFVGNGTWQLQLGVGSTVSRCLFAQVSGRTLTMYELVPSFAGGSPTCASSPAASPFVTVVSNFGSGSSVSDTCGAVLATPLNVGDPPPCPPAYLSPIPPAYFVPLSNTWWGAGDLGNGISLTVTNNSVSWMDYTSGSLKRYCFQSSVALPSLPVPAGVPTSVSGYPKGVIGLKGATPTVTGLAALDFLNTYTYPVANPGFYNLAGAEAVACPLPAGHDFGRDVCIVACSPANSCIGNNECGAGYVSIPPSYRCASCAPKFYSSAGVCVKCPDSPIALIVCVLLVVIVLAVAGYMLNKRQVNIAVLSIGVDFFQVLAIFANMKITWPPEMKQLLAVLSAFNLNIDIVAPECLVPNVGYRAKFLVVVAMPIVLFAFLGLVFGVQVLDKFQRGHRDKAKLLSGLPALVSSSLVLMYLLYLYLTRTILGLFDCVPISPPDGHLYLSSVNPLTECGVPGGAQVGLMPYGVVALLVYSLGYPTFITQKLWRNRELVMEDQLLRAKGVGHDGLSNPHALTFRRMFGRSYFQFKPDWCLWILAIIVRKFAIAIVAVMFNKNSSFQMAACLFIMFVAYTAQVQIRPYMSPADYDEVLASHDVSVANASPIHARLRATIAAIETTGRKKARKNLLTAEGRIDTAVMLGLLSNWLFNYNTVEAVMQFSAVLVCLLALMYQASIQNSYYQSGQGGITGVIIFVIALSIFYFFFVVVTEIVTLATADSRRRVALAFAERRKAKAVAEASAADSPAPGSPRAGGRGSRRGSSSGRALLQPTAAKEFDPGVVSARMNPLFMKADSAKAIAASDGAPPAPSAFSGDKSIATTIAAQREAPLPELWVHFHASIGGLLETVRAAQEELKALRAAEAALAVASEVAAATGRIETAAARAARSASEREEFGSSRLGSATPRAGGGAPDAAATSPRAGPQTPAERLARYASSRRSSPSASDTAGAATSPLQRLRASASARSPKTG